MSDVVRLAIGTEVRVISNSKQGGWTEDVRLARQNKLGQEGTVQSASDAHGPCYEVAFAGDRSAWFDHDELEALHRELSAKSQAIFLKMKPWFPNDSWGNAKWHAEGIVNNGRRYDLRKSADRNALIEWELLMIGSAIENSASVYATKHKGEYVGYELEQVGSMVAKRAELVRHLRDLDFQIETGDLVDP